MSKSTDDSNGLQPKSAVNWLFKVATWLITVLCFYLVFSRTQATAAREGCRWQTTCCVFSRMRIGRCG